MKDGDTYATLVDSTTAGLQQAIDSLAGGKGKVFIGPGTLSTTDVISLHSGCHLQGSGPGVTVIQRAAGSFTGSSAAYSANMIISSAFGSNGTLSDSAAPQTDISVTDLTIDGNQSSFSSVVFSDLSTGHYGIKFQYVDGVLLHNLEIKELLQTGTDLVSCANARCSNLRFVNCGQYATAASRNSFNFNNGTAGAIAAGYAQSLVLTNMVSEGSQDTHVTLKNVNDCAISNCTFDGALIGIELENTAAIGSVFKNYTISNIAAKNITGNFLRVSPSASTGYENITVQDVVCDFHSTNHGNDIATIHSAAIFLGRTNDAYIKALKIRNGVFRNINSFSSNTEMAMLVAGLPGTTACSDWDISGLSFYGANGSENNSVNRGMDIYGNITNARFRDIYISGAEGVGVHVRPASGSVAPSQIKFSNVFVDGCQEDAFKCLVDQAGATISRVEFVNCSAKNAAIASTSYRCFFVGVSTSTGTCSDIAVRDCLGWRTSSVCNGLEVYQSGSATVDGITIVDNDFSDLGAGHSAYISTGSPTNVWFDDIPMKGTAIASATTVTLGRGNLFGVSGTTTIDTITPYSVFDCRPVSFHFGSTAGIGDGTGNCRLAGAFTATANDYITLRYDKANSVWFEVARSGDI